MIQDRFNIYFLHLELAEPFENTRVFKVSDKMFNIFFIY